MRTSDICDTEHASMADLLHAALVGVEGPGARDGTRRSGSAVRDVCLRVGARLGGRLLD